MVDQPYDGVRARIADRVQELAAQGLHGEELCSEPGKRAAVMVFVSRPLRGSNPMAVVMQSAKWTMMHVQVQEVEAGTRVVVVAGGAETIWGTDWGRNRSLVDFMLSA